MSWLNPTIELWIEVTRYPDAPRHDCNVLGTKFLRLLWLWLSTVSSPFSAEPLGVSVFGHAAPVDGDMFSVRDNASVESGRV